MKKYLLLLLIFLFFIKIAAQEATPLSIGEQKTLKSDILKENRTINIYLPQNFDKTKSYPVIYLLDETMNEDFLHIVGLTQLINGLKPKFIKQKISDFEAFANLLELKYKN